VRPKKRILLIDSNENRQSMRRFVFETRGLAVFSASTPDEARDLSRDAHPDVVIAVWPFTGGDLAQLVDQVREEAPFAPSLLIVENLSVPPTSIVADATMCKGAFSMADVVERIKVLAARKRGPRPGFKITPAPVEIADLEERRIV